MFDSLSDRLRKTLGNLTGRGRVSEADVDAVPDIVARLGRRVHAGMDLPADPASA